MIELLPTEPGWVLIMNEALYEPIMAVSEKIRTYLLTLKNHQLQPATLSAWEKYYLILYIRLLNQHNNNKLLYSLMFQDGHNVQIRSPVWTSNKQPKKTSFILETNEIVDLISQWSFNYPVKVKSDIKIIVIRTTKPPGEYCCFYPNYSAVT